ncbi:MAG: primosomal protein N' (replication factor Y) - superfamily II helicase [bacterium]
MEITEFESVQHSFPCEQCGAQLQYKEGSQQLACVHCGHLHDIVLSREPIVEYDFHSTLKHLPGGAPDAISLSVKCHACSAEFEFDSDLHADECPFCGTKIVVDAQQHRVIQPKALLPFRIDTREASAAYKKWLRRLWFAPNKLKKYARKERQLNGVYVPYWTYDCDTDTRYSGQRGDIYQVAQKVRVKVNGRITTQTRMVNKIRWTPASGAVRRSFDDVLVYATDSLPRSMARELAPWDLNELAPFQEEFLSGFQSEVYKVELDQGFDYAKQHMHPTIRQDIRQDIGGDRQRINNSDTRYSRISFKHILLPFWIAGFRFRNKTYQFIVNARTGEVQGDRPWSAIKIALAVLLAAAVAGTLAYFYMQGEMAGQFDTIVVPWNSY